MKLFEPLRNMFNMNNAPATLSRQYPVGVIATRDNYDYATPGEILPNPDKILQKNGLTLEVYSDFLVDAHVASCVQSRKSGILSLEWEISRDETNPSPYADFVENLFNDIDLRQLISEILDTPLYGYKPIEIVWTQKNGYIVPMGLAGKPPWWFAFDNVNRLKFLHRDNLDGISAPENKFLLPRHNATYDNPYGEALLAKCYYPVMFKKGGLKLWATFTEKYGMPFLLGKVPIHAAAETAGEMFNMLSKLQQDNTAVVYEDDDVTVLEANKTSSADIYQKLLHFCNAEISKAILSQTLTTEQGDTGSYAMSQTHLTVRRDVVEADKKLVENTINQLIKMTLNLNYGKIEDYPEFVLFETTDVDMNLAQRDATLANTGQIKFSQLYFKRKYGFEDDEFSITEVAPAPAPAFSEQQDEESARDLAQMTEKMLAPVVELIESGAPYSELQEKIIDIFPILDTKDVEDYIAQAILIASGSGIIDGVNAE